MPVPLPETEVLLTPPDYDEVILSARAKVTAVCGPDGLTDIQRYVLVSHLEALTGVHVDLDGLEPLGPSEYADAMRRRNEAFRVRMVQTMLLAAFVVTPLREDVVERIREYAYELSVDDGMIDIAREISHGSRRLVMADFSRAGYHASDDRSIEAVLHVDASLSDDWSVVEDDQELAERWAALGDLAPGSLGRRVWEFYRARGFQFPGSPGSAPPLLAQHDWVHVLADYGSTVESEIEVFGFIARANDDPRAFSLLAMVLSLFETGTLESASIFQFDPSHLSQDGRHMAVRLADGMRRGAVVGAHFAGQDLLAVDWFALADQQVDVVRDLMGIPPKSELAREAGSVGPADVGGITTGQLTMGSGAADARGEPYDSYGALVVEGSPTSSY